LEAAEQLAGVGVEDLVIERAAEAVVALMDAPGGRLRSTAQILLSRVQGGV